METELIATAIKKIGKEAFEKDYAPCPVCNGSGRRPYDGGPYSYGLDAETNTVPCNNCNQFFWDPLGYVRRRPDGTPCVHKYAMLPQRFSCFQEYRCEHCGDRFDVDSSG